MSFSWTAIITWLLVGSLAGSLTGTLVKGSKGGYGRWTNLGIGLVGALIGGALFSLFGIDLGLSRIAISVQDLVAAFLGSLLFLVGLRVWKKRKTKESRA